MEDSVRDVVPGFIRENYAVKFAIVLLVIGISVSAIGLVGTEMIAAGVEEQADQNSRELAEQEARNVDKWNQLNVIHAQRMSNEVTTANDPQSYLGSELFDLKGVDNIHYVDASENQIRHSTNNGLAGESLSSSEEAWAQEMRNYGSGENASDGGTNDSENASDGGTIFGYDPVKLSSEPALVPHTADDGTPVLSYVIRVNDAFAEYLVISMELSQFTDEMINSEDSGRISYIVNEETGRIVMDPTGESVFAEHDPSLDLSEVDTNATTHDIGTPGEALRASVDDEYQNEEYMISAARVNEDSSFLVIVHTPKSEAYGFVDTVSEYGIYASFGGLLLVVLIGGVIGRNTSRSIDQLRFKAERMEEGDLDVELDTDRVDEIGQLYGGFASMRDSLKTQIRSVQQAREEAERARQETERINEHLVAKADDYRSVMRECADGDFTARMDPDSENEAMEEIASEFNEMVAEIEETTSNLKAFATEVATASEQVTASSEEVQSASEQVTESIQEISDGAERQNENLQSVTLEMNDLSTTIEQIAASSNRVADIAERTEETGTRGREAAQEAISGMSEIEAESEAAVDEIETLEAEMNQIDDLVEFISEVAEQTNMLALNANIEASRSADSSEGFSVVAGEVKDLAEETKTAAEDIEARIEAIKTQTGRTAEEVQRTSDRIANHRDAIEQTVDALDEIADYAEETNSGVQEISAATEQQAASTQEGVAMIDEVATISEETTAEAQTVAAAAEEQTTALTEVSQSASDLSGRAARLSETLDRFDTDTDVDSLTSMVWNGPTEAGDQVIAPEPISSDDGGDAADSNESDGGDVGGSDQSGGGGTDDSNESDDADDVFTFGDDS